MTTLRVRRVWRVSRDDHQEELSFEDGLNLIVGPPNSGKTKWMRMIDHCLADSDSSAKALGREVAERYASIGVDAMVGDKAWTIERSLVVTGLRSKIIVNGVALNPSDMSTLLMDELDIPRFRFRRGGATAPRVEVSWRMLMAHLHRRERGWYDLHQGQYPSERHASALALLNLASHLESPDVDLAVQLREQLVQVQARSSQFARTLQEIAYEVLTLEEVAIGLSAESLSRARMRLVSARDEAERRRAEMIRQVPTESQAFSADDSLSAELARLRDELDSLNSQREAAATRLKELDQYRQEVASERRRWQRAQVAGRLFSAARIEQCPVCDQPVEPEKDLSVCFLCHRPYSKASDVEANERIEVEFAQLAEEEREAGELLAEARSLDKTLQQRATAVGAQLSRIENLLRPTRMAVARAVPAEFNLLSQEIGRIDELIGQVDRVGVLLARKGAMDRETDELRRKLTETEARIQLEAGTTPFTEAAGALSDSMNDYLNLLGRQRWPRPPVTVRLNESDFEVLVGEERWSQLGATLTCYLVASYHYALLTLTSRPEFRYPGIVLLDFPAALADLPPDAENYVVQPFTDAILASGLPTQVIAAGRALNIDGVTRRVLSHVWGAA